MVYGIKDLKTIKEVDKMLIKAIKLFNDAGTIVENLRLDLKTKTIREETHTIIKIASRQQEKLENMRNNIYYDIYKLELDLMKLREREKNNDIFKQP